MLRVFKLSREAIKKYFLILILGLVSISMVITLAPLPSGDGTQMQTNVLADLDGHQITVSEFQQAVHQRFRNMPSEQTSAFIAAAGRELLDDLVFRRAVWKQAEKLGLTVSDQELLLTLQNFRIFHQNGSFIGYDRYQDIVQQQTGMNVPQFEAQLRENILLDKLQSVLGNGVRVSPEEVRQEFQRRNLKVKVEYVSFAPSQLLSAVEVTTAALESFFQKNPDRYRLPEQRRIRYVVVDLDRARAEVKVTDEDLKQYYAQHLADYQVPDRVKVSHILFKTVDKQPDEVAALQKSAEEVLGQINAGKSFAELAKKYSADSTAANGGDLGWVVRGQTVKEFEEAAFSMKPGQVSDLIRTTYGIHILKVFARETAHLQTFDEVKDAIRKDLEKKYLVERQQAIADNFAREAQANPKEFSTLAGKYRLTPKDSDLFRYNQPVVDLGSGQTFQNLAFQLRENEVGIPITVPKGLAVIQVTEIVPEHLPKLAEVKALVEQDYRAQQSKGLAEAKALKFAEKVKTTNFRTAAAELGYTVQAPKEFSQQDYIEGLGSGSMLAQAFKLAPGQTGGPILVSENQVVFKVLDHLPPSELEFPGQQAQITEQLLERKRSLLFDLYRQNLKQHLLKSGELKLNEQAIKQLLASYQRQ